MHRAGDFRDALEIAMHVFVAVDMRFKNFPIVYARLPGRTRVRKHEAGLDFLRNDGNSFAVNAVGVKVNGADSAVERGIVILATGGNLDDLRFDVLRDHAHLLEREVPVGEAGERGGGGDHERRRS